MCEKMGHGALGGGSLLCSPGPGCILPRDCGQPTSLPLGVLSLHLPATPISFYRTLTLTWSPCPGAESSLPGRNSELQAEAGTLFVSEPLRPCPHLWVASCPPRGNLEGGARPFLLSHPILDPLANPTCSIFKTDAEADHFPSFSQPPPWPKPLSPLS